jgi:hypothetical protein
MPNHFPFPLIFQVFLLILHLISLPSSFTISPHRIRSSYSLKRLTAWLIHLLFYFYRTIDLNTKTAFLYKLVTRVYGRA